MVNFLSLISIFLNSGLIHKESGTKDQSTVKAGGVRKCNFMQMTCNTLRYTSGETIALVLIPTERKSSAQSELNM